MKAFRTYRLLQRTAVMAVVASLAILLIAGSAAFAASPNKGGRYTGKTSQGEPVTVDVDRKNEIHFLEAYVTYPCSRLGPIRTFEIASLYE